MSDHDTLQRFLFENAPIRGELVHMDASWQAVLQRHDYPASVRDLLGQMMAASVLLSATLKFDGAITIQVQGNGPVSLMVVECTSERTVRGVAHWQGEVPTEDLRLQVGDGRLVITIDPGEGRERYQGIVALEGSTLAEALDNYLERSEQLGTRMWLAADESRVAGLLLQKLPAPITAEEDETWNRVGMLGATITSAELLELPPRETMRRLFHEEDVRVFEDEPVAFRCSCSRERVAGMLRGLGQGEVRQMIEDDGAITVHCEFCNQRYDFDAVDAEQLFAEGFQPGTPPTQH